MSCMRIFRLNKKGCYNLINAQNDQFVFEVDENFVETSKCSKVASFKIRSKSVDSFLVPWWLNIGIVVLSSILNTFICWLFEVT